ncbi:MAG: hypothetical protein SFH39_16645 [Candidatus Magnetobacterium sp. LHC-1]
MITEAYISGQVGKAIYEEDGKFFLIKNKEGNKPVEWVALRSNVVTLLKHSNKGIL